MSFHWEKNLDIAKAIEQCASKITEAQKREAAYRAAVSRAYYGVMKVSFLRFSRDYTFRRQNVHEQVRKRLENYPARVGITRHQASIAKRLHNQFKRLRAYRNEADYQDVLNSKPADLASFSIKIAEKYLGSIKKI